MKVDYTAGALWAFAAAYVVATYTAGLFFATEMLVGVDDVAEWYTAALTVATLIWYVTALIAIVAHAFITTVFTHDS